MSESRRRDLVLGDLISVLTGPTSPTTIATEPYASSEAGLCQRDVIELKYRSEEHTSELQSLMRISYAVFCLKKKKKNNNKPSSEKRQTTSTRTIRKR